MNRRISRVVVAAIAIITTVGVLAPAAEAVPVSSTQGAPHRDETLNAGEILSASSLTAQQIAAARADLPQVAKLERDAVTVSANGTLTFDVLVAKRAKVSQRIIDEYALGLTLSGGSVVGVSKAGLAATVSAAPALQALAKSSCRGRNNTGTAVWGPYIQLDSCNTNRLIAALGAGAGVATVAALLSGAVGVGLAAGVVAAVLAIGGGAVAFCAADGNGVVLRLLWTGTPYCTGP